MSVPALALPSRPSPLERLRALEELGPRRVTGTPLEKAAQERLGAELASLGYHLEWRSFRWSRSLYASLLLHFGLATVATGLGLGLPWLGAALHGVVALSYALESLRRPLLLRSLFPSITSQNLLATKPARTERKRRLVLVAHADAAYTGVLFTPALIAMATKEPPRGLGFLKKHLGMATFTIATLAVLEGLAAADVWSAPIWLRGALSIPATLTFLLNLDVVLRNQVVPGAADNLSGCTACVELAHRLEGRLPDDVELVIVISGAEEAGTGGARRLAESVLASGEWSRQDTIVLGLDTLTNGKLRLLEEGELWRMPVPAIFNQAMAAENAAHPERTQISTYVIPTGASDALPFLAYGYQAASLTCIDPKLGAPRHYHHPTDTWRNVDVEELEASIEYAERFILRLAALR